MTGILLLRPFQSKCAEISSAFSNLPLCLFCVLLVRRQNKRWHPATALRLRRMAEVRPGIFGESCSEIRAEVLDQGPFSHRILISQAVDSSLPIRYPILTHVCFAICRKALCECKDCACKRSCRATIINIYIYIMYTYTMNILDILYIRYIYIYTMRINLFGLCPVRLQFSNPP